MKPKSNFVVEVKKRRLLDGKQKKRSLWAGVDLDDAKRQVTDASEPALARSRDRAGETESAAAAPAMQAQPRILPVVTEPVTDDRHTPAGISETSLADLQHDPVQNESDTCRPRLYRRKPRLRRWQQKPLPIGQRWKYRLPRVLQKRR